MLFIPSRLDAAHIHFIQDEQSAIHALDEVKAPPLGGIIGRGVGEKGDGGSITGVNG